MRKSVTVGFVTIFSGSALLGQTQPAQTPMTSEYQRAYDQAYEKAFRTAFRNKSVEQCVSSATKAAASRYDFTPTCACAADKLLATKTVEQLKALPNEGSGATIKAVTAECLASNPLLLSAKP